ncbi:MAG: DUF2191 domain-containing protein [Chloroflexota bacterium]
MKTTIDIADALLEDAKRVAARDGITLRALVEDGLRKALSERTSGRSGFKLKDASFRGNGTQPGIDLSNWEQIRDLIYEGHGA